MASQLAKSLQPAIQAAFDEGGIEMVCEYVAAQIQASEARITQLEKRLNKNSKNSSKPPSSDGLGRNNRGDKNKSKGRKPKGQKGHKGHTLQQAEKPDVQHHITLDRCPKCDGDLTVQPVHHWEKRQVFDIPPIELKVTEYAAECKICPHCRAEVRALFPDGVTACVQYGPRILALLSYLNVGQLLPCSRIADMCDDIFGHRPSPGTVVRAVIDAAQKIAPVVEEIAQELQNASHLHADETGVHSEGKTDLPPKIRTAKTLDFRGLMV